MPVGNQEQWAVNIRLHSVALHPAGFVAGTVGGGDFDARLLTPRHGCRRRVNPALPARTRVAHRQAALKQPPAGVGDGDLHAGDLPVIDGCDANRLAGLAGPFGQVQFPHLRRMEVVGDARGKDRAGLELGLVGRLAHRVGHDRPGIAGRVPKAFLVRPLRRTGLIAVEARRPGQHLPVAITPKDERADFPADFPQARMKLNEGHELNVRVVAADVPDRVFAPAARLRPPAVSGSPAGDPLD